MTVALPTADFDFALPDRLIAQRPPAERGASRLLVCPLGGGPLQHRTFAALPTLLRAGDMLVVNDTRVFPARLLGRRVPTGGAVECLLLRRLADAGAPPAAGGCEDWAALVKPGQTLQPGARLTFGSGGVALEGEIVARLDRGARVLRLCCAAGTVASAIETLGHVPLPPYIDRADDADDRERYQTVYADVTGSVAAPTAGLHFTPRLLDELRARGVEQTAVTLHVGLGTFKPVRVDDLDDHEMDAEPYAVSDAAAAALSRARREGRRIIAVGTTTTRVLESLPLDADGVVPPGAGTTHLFIRPGHVFRLVDGLITNFHLPRSSLLALVSALAGRERVLAAYREAVAHEYRFYSYGDAMVIM